MSANVQNEGSGRRGENSPPPHRGNLPRNVDLSPWMNSASRTEHNLKGESHIAKFQKY